VVHSAMDRKETSGTSQKGLVMFTQDQQELMTRIDKSDFIGAKSFVNNIRRQGFMTSKQYDALCNMNNSIKPWSSRTRFNSLGDGWDHDDLAEGWGGY
jgi:hypothetical protein